MSFLSFSFGLFKILIADIIELYCSGWPQHIVEFAHIPTKYSPFANQVRGGQVRRRHTVFLNGDFDLTELVFFNCFNFYCIFEFVIQSSSKILEQL